MERDDGEIQRSKIESETAALRASAHVPDGVVPDDIHVMRLALARRMVAFCGRPRHCREALCRRTQRCVGPTMRCQHDSAEPRMTASEQAAMMADMRKALEKAIARHGETERPADCDPPL